MAKKVLVVDNEKNILDMMSKFLSREGFEVLTATNGINAIDLAKKSAPDLIILDVMMPGMDGGDIAANLLENEKTSYIPVIFLTGAISEEEAMKQSSKFPNRTYISKAGDIRKLMKIVRQILDS